ncbi:BamA/TamA family outer membrane protein [Granulicella tundricola]|uniref:Surface antigen variable number repeat-containing protein n=1 Tax=Granulicella tundricola (strain ATCC BAA-1859 / DSM 23138 / MP5ACTX9) TaxID=1198114 RepID=E8WYH5_GRATM|nr:hypothetical protein [Granulicella tundricola]ADW69881.1 surface antigen variable number repeat-containing protein [Granulicella tundricola MP5ACTX9]
MKFLLVLLLWCAPLMAQTYTFKTIMFEGASQYSQAELLAMSGLSTSKAVTNGDLQTALHKLDDTGFFSKINYKTDGQVLHITLEAIAGSQARKVTYTNFVIDTPEDLNTKVHQRLPAFNGTVPNTGEMEQQVARALEGILQERGIHATVTSIGGAEGDLKYSIASPEVVVGKIAVAGVDLGKDAKLATVRDRILGSPYTEGQSGEALRTNLMDTYQDLGYVNFSMGTIGHGAPVVSAERISVDLTGEAQVGALYIVGQVTAPAAEPRVDRGDLKKANQLKAGAPASRIEVMSTVARLGQVFEGHGYLDEKTSVDATKNDAAHTVSYVFRTVAGESYRFHALKTPGLTEQQDAEVRKSFTLVPGSLYDRSAIGALGTTAMRTICNGSPLRMGLQKDQKTHEVDVMFTCPGKR